MSASSSQFTGSIPEYYDRSLGPILFAFYAQDMAARAAAAAANDVLELAAGTGIVTRRLFDLLPKTTRLIATDLNAPMLEIAARKFQTGESVTFQPADAMNLPFANQTFDLLVCQFGVMFFPDKVMAFREAHRVLKPGGRYHFNVWGPMSANPFAMVADKVGATYFANDPPKFYRVPFSYADTAKVEADARAAGFTEVQHEVLRVSQEVADWPQFAEGIVRGNPLIAEIEARKSVSPTAYAESIVDALRAAFGTEPAKMPLEASVFTCRV